MKKKHFLLTCLIGQFLGYSVPAPSWAESKKIWVAIEPQIAKIVESKGLLKNQEKIQGAHETFSLVDEEQLPQLTKAIHEQFKRCGGYRVMNQRPGEKEINRPQGFVPFNSANLLSPDYRLDQEEILQGMLPDISEFYMNYIITKLSAYPNRYYKSAAGVAAFKWIGEEWGRLTNGRSDAEVEFYQYADHKQPSVILTFKGAGNTSDDEAAEEIIVLGGHADSINTDQESIHSPAPGADDNAAGIAVLSAIIKTMVESNYRPRRTIQFIAYAAEEVGIQGSYELARVYRENKKKVLGVLQFDGLNFGGKSYDLALISDNTNVEQNQFVAQLIDLYLHVPWTWDKCGYICSDHAAWNFEGFRASYPIEAIKKEFNPYIHTAKDTFAQSNYSSAHAKKFAQLGMAFLVELDQ